MAFDGTSFNEGQAETFAAQSAAFKGEIEAAGEEFLQAVNQLNGAGLLGQSTEGTASLAHATRSAISEVGASSDQATNVLRSFGSGVQGADRTGASQIGF